MVGMRGDRLSRGRDEWWSSGGRKRPSSGGVGEAYDDIRRSTNAPPFKRGRADSSSREELRPGGSWGGSGMSTSNSRKDGHREAPPRSLNSRGHMGRNVERGEYSMNRVERDIGSFERIEERHEPFSGRSGSPRGGSRAVWGNASSVNGNSHMQADSRYWNAVRGEGDDQHSVSRQELPLPTSHVAASESNAARSFRETPNSLFRDQPSVQPIPSLRENDRFRNERHQKFGSATDGSRPSLTMAHDHVESDGMWYGHNVRPDISSSHIREQPQRYVASPQDEWPLSRGEVLQRGGSSSDSTFQSRGKSLPLHHASAPGRTNITQKFMPPTTTGNVPGNTDKQGRLDSQGAFDRRDRNYRDVRGDIDHVRSNDGQKQGNRPQLSKDRDATLRVSNHSSLGTWRDGKTIGNNVAYHQQRKSQPLLDSTGVSRSGGGGDGSRRGKRGTFDQERVYSDHINNMANIRGGEDSKHHKDNHSTTQSRYYDSSSGRDSNGGGSSMGHDILSYGHSHATPQNKRFHNLMHQKDDRGMIIRSSSSSELRKVNQQYDRSYERNSTLPVQSKEFGSLSRPDLKVDMMRVVLPAINLEKDIDSVESFLWQMREKQLMFEGARRSAQVG